MQRDAHRRVQPPRNGRPLLERQIAIVVTGHRDAHPTPFYEIVAELARQGEAQILFIDLSRNACGARVATAVAGIDDDDRTTPRLGSAVDMVRDRRRNVDGEAGLRRRTASADEREQQRARGEHTKCPAGDCPSFAEASRHPPTH